ncbi:hypothetical protein [Methylomicrobium lacus]|uniref:hypothetical protein n=1 Tax=Methylomicrobium lacus TaxID=136992 RepID=UPI0035A90D9F
MTRIPDRNTSGSRHAEASECQTLVDPGKSRRLRAMLQGKTAEMQEQQAAAAVEPDNALELPADVARELQQARRIIDDEIERIMRLLPEGRKNSLFKIRFGHLEAIRAMEVQEIFKRLKLADTSAQLNRLRKINYHGEKVS